jgi:hypothetical protein
MQIGYCTNVHAGVTLDQIKRNLDDVAVAVSRKAQLDTPMGIGLWIPNSACTELIAPKSAEEFSDWLAQRDLVPFTINGFPFDDFHQPVVRHQVYRPTWADEERLRYTENLAEILARLLPEGAFGSISTLPLGWSKSSTGEFLTRCGSNIRNCARRLREIHEQENRQIFLCIEPEPGCAIDTSLDLAQFFDEYLLRPVRGGGQGDDWILNYVGVCHDVCHSAVMFEEQSDALRNYADAGIQIGKYQISSAVEADFRGFRDSHTQQALVNQLRGFAETRYLHQTMIRKGDQTIFFEDLSLAIEQSAAKLAGLWRVHFHVPIFVERFGLLGTTNSDIEQCLAAICRNAVFPTHLEIETYAWGVLPDRTIADSLADGIAHEIHFLRNLLNSLGRFEIGTFAD